MRLGDLIVRPFKKTLPLGLWETATSFAARISSLWPSSSATEFWGTVGLPFARFVNGDRESIVALLASSPNSRASYRNIHRHPVRGS